MPEPPVETLAVVMDWWIALECGCGRHAFLPVRLLAKQHGVRASLPALVERMRCAECGARPVDAALVDRLVEGWQGGVAPTRRPIG